jgi:hypothetical protein
MKHLEEIQEMLISELCDSLDNLSSSVELDYYNELMGDTSFLLAGYLQRQLSENFQDWDEKKWIDDSLLTKIKIDGNKLCIWGVMIWGVENLTEQWTEPFYFDVVLNESLTDFTKSTLLFGDANCLEITYEEFNQNRGFWDKGYYSNNNWHQFERDWKYVINSSNEIKIQE